MDRYSTAFKFPSQPLELAQAMAEAGEAPEVVLESTYGWYRAADLLKELAFHGPPRPPPRQQTRATRAGPIPSTPGDSPLELQSADPRVTANYGILPARKEMWGEGGSAQLDSLELPGGYASRLDSLRDLIEVDDREVRIIDSCIHSKLRGDSGYRAIQKIEGVGPVIGAIFVAEIGDVCRFDSPKRLCSRGGLTPKHRESDDKVRRGPAPSCTALPDGL